MQIKPSLKLPKTLSAKKWKFTNSGHTGHLKLMMCLMTLYLADLNSQKIFFPMGRSRPLFVYFCSFLITISMIQIEQAKDGVIGIQNRGRRMVDTDETMELCRPPTLRLLCFNISAAVVNDVTIFLVEIFFPIFKTSKTSSSTKQEIFLSHHSVKFYCILSWR